MIKEFKEFISRGNALDLAVGVIMGAAFGKIVSSFVADLFMPLLGLLLGGVDFTQLGITLRASSEGKEALVFAYGKFIQAVIDFFLISIGIFFMIKGINQFRTKKEEAPAPPAEDIVLLTEIRDLLKNQK